MKSKKAAIGSRLRNRLLGIPSQEENLKNIQPQMKLKKLEGLADWARKEMGDTYIPTMDAAVLRYWKKLDEYMKREECTIVKAVRNVPYTIPRGGIRKSRRKGILNYGHMKEIESLKNKIHDIKDNTRRDSYAFEQDMRDLGITDKRSLGRYITMKPSQIAYEETCRKYGWPLKWPTIEKYIKTERETVKRRMRMLEWWQSVISSYPDPD